MIRNEEQIFIQIAELGFRVNVPLGLHQAADTSLRSQLRMILKHVSNFPHVSNPFISMVKARHVPTHLAESGP